MTDGPTPDPDWERPAARSLLVSPLRNAKELIPTLAPLVLVAVSQGGQAYWLLLLAAILPVLLAVLRWWTTGFRIAHGQFQVRHGIVRKHLLLAQLDRIRTVDAEASLLRRLLRVVDLRVGTGAHESVEVHGVDAARAAALHRDLLARRAPSTAGPEPLADVPAHDERPVGVPEQALARFEPAWLRFAPFTMSGVATALTAWAIGTRFVNDLGLQDHVTPWIDRARDATERQSWAVLAADLVLGGAVVLSVLSVVAYALANWGYRLTRRADATLHIRRGLLTSRAVTIEEARLRGAVVEHPLLLRVPRGARAKALVTGGHRRAEGARGSSVLVPPSPEAVVAAAVAAVLRSEEPLRCALTRHGGRATRRRYTRALACVAPLAAVPALAAWRWEWPTWTYVAPALILAAVPVLGALRARWLGHALIGDPTVLEGPEAGYLVASSGAFPQSRSCLRTRAIIGWVLRESLFQRRAGLVTLEATLASTGGRVQILDVPRDRAVQIIRTATPGLLEPYLG